MSKLIKLAVVACLTLSISAVSASAASNESQFPAGSKMAKLAETGKIKVGVQTQYPLIGMKTLSGYAGFDIDIAKLIATKLGISMDNVEFVPVTTPTREPFLEQEKVDMVIAAYTITPSREKVVDFSGPYLPSPSGIMVKNDNPLGIKSLADMKEKHLCVSTGSAQEVYVSKNFPEVRKTLVTFDSSAKCALAVVNGQADASSTDLPILAALAKQNDGKLQVIDFHYDTSSWGIGVTKTKDKTFCKWINKTLAELYSDGSWAKAYKSTIGTVVPGPVPTPPAIGGTCSGS